MAKNWLMKEALGVVQSGNKEDIIDIGKRFPLTLCALAAIGDNVGAKAIIEAIPEFITVRKIEASLKGGIESDEDEIIDPKEMKVAEDEIEEKPKKERKKKVVDPREEMSEVELFKLCKAKGIKAKPKQDKEYYLDLLKENEEEVEEKPAKKAAPKKGTKAVAKKKEVPMNPPEDAEDTEEDEDDWDI